MNISQITAQEISDSRGLPTLRITVYAGSASGSFDVPSGASTGSHEALELRDGGNEHAGKGVKKAIAAVEGPIAGALVGHDVADQQGIDTIMRELDGTKQKAQLGGNAIIGVSIAAAKAAAATKDFELYEYLRTLRNIPPSRKVPLLFMNVLNGGKHAKYGPAFQEYHLIPQTDDVAVAKNIGEAFMKQLETYAREKFGDRYGTGDEGGLVFPLADPEEPLKIMREMINKNPTEVPVRFGLDVAASSFFEKQTNIYYCGSSDLSPSQLQELYARLIKEYDLYTIEDPFEEEAYSDFAALQESHGDIIVVGDDLTVTNVERLNPAIEKRAIRALIIKPNQIGTLTETLDTMELARSRGIHCIVSHRSGDTMDDAISDIAYAYGTFGLKCGVPRQPERIVKIDRLITISHE